MKSKVCQFTPKKRRGLSSVVGALLFVVLMVATFSVLGIALNTQTDIVSTGRDVADINLKKQQEEFIIGVTSNPFPLLEVTVNNQGQNPVEIFTMIITNKTNATAGYPTTVYDIPSDTSFITTGDTSNILSTTPLTLSANNTYGIKVISSLGTIKKVDLTCGSSSCGFVGVTGLFTDLFMDPPIGIPTKNVTVAMLVTNTGNVQLTNVQPVETDPTIELPGTSSILGGPTFDSFSPITLQPHQSALFRWDLQVDGQVGDVWSFTNRASASDGVETIFSANSTDQMILIDPNDCGGCGAGGPGGGGGGSGDEDILDERFITRPELFLTIPSPFGLGGDGGDKTNIIRGLWGANVVNPTNTTMFIHKITITAYPPASNDNINIIKSKNADPLYCNPQDISPGDGNVPSPIIDPDDKQIDEAGFWTCPGANTIMWRSYSSPVTLPPFETFPFLVKLQSHSPMSKNVEAVLVDSTVFTTSGSFGKGNYQSTAYTLGMLANIYETTDPLNPLDLTKIVTSRLGIDSGSVQKFHIVLAEQDIVASSYIKAGSKIVVNVPRAFTLVDVIEDETTGIVKTPLGVEPSIVIHPDKTTQIIATITDDIGDQVTAEAVVLTFEATAPVVETIKLMVMYTLGNGEGQGGISVGPLSELILQVIPPP